MPELLLLAEGPQHPQPGSHRAAVGDRVLQKHSTADAEARLGRQRERTRAYQCWPLVREAAAAKAGEMAAAPGVVGSLRLSGGC